MRADLRASDAYRLDAFATAIRLSIVRPSLSILTLLLKEHSDPLSAAIRVACPAQVRLWSANGFSTLASILGLQ